MIAPVPATAVLMMLAGLGHGDGRKVILERKGIEWRRDKWLEQWLTRLRNKKERKKEGKGGEGGGNSSESESWRKFFTVSRSRTSF